MGVGKIGIELERVLAFGYSTFGAVGHAHDEAVDAVSVRVTGGERKRLRCVPLRRCKARSAVFRVEVGHGQERIYEGRPDKRVDVFGIDPQPLRKETLGARKLNRIVAFVEAGLAAKIEVHRIRVRRAFRPPRLGRHEGRVQLARDAGDDLVLHREEIRDRLVESVGPDMRAGLSVYELRIDAHPIAASQDAPFEHIPNAKFAPDLLEIDRLALVGERGVPGDDEGAANP